MFPYQEKNEIKFRIWQIHPHSHVHHSIIHSSQEVKQPKHPSMNKWIKNNNNNKWIYTHHGVVVGYKKEEILCHKL